MYEAADDLIRLVREEEAARRTVSGREAKKDDCVTREKAIEWARLAGMDDMMSESRIAMLADFAIFARAIPFMDGMSVPHAAPRGSSKSNFSGWPRTATAPGQ